jgi:hypothetical protein
LSPEMRQSGTEISIDTTCKFYRDAMLPHLNGQIPYTSG